jgi:hypothetical protein
MWAGVAPIPAWSGHPDRYRLNRGGNPSSQRRTAPHCDHPAPYPSRCPELPPTASRCRQHQEGSPPSTQTQTRRRRLPDTAQRHSIDLHHPPQSSRLT